MKTTSSARIAKLSGILITAALAPVVAHALIAGPAVVTGTVKSFDTKKVVLETSEGEAEIPRELVAEKNVKTGTKLEVSLLPENVSKVNFRVKKGKGPKVEEKKPESKTEVK